MPRAILAAIVLAVTCLPRDAAALPDVVPEIFDVAIHPNSTVDPGDVVEGCAGAETGRTLLDFSLRTRNLGPDDLVMGDPGCPDCSTYPGVPCANPLYVCSAAHGHPHFEGYALAEVLDAQNHVVAVGHKQGFCLLDLECATPQFDCGFQGITAGCADVYDVGLPCQYVDITDAGLPDGDYTLRVTVDPGNAIPEANESNNVTSVPVHLGPPTTPPPPTCPVMTATDLPKVIPDNGTAVSTLTNLAPGTIDHVRVVDLRGTHTYISDVAFELQSPQGTSVTIVDHVCGSDHDFQVDLADAANSTIVCPLTGGGYFQPSHPLTPFSGQTASGTWTLRAVDSVSGDSGSLDGWGLEICTRCGNGTLDPGEICDDGNTADGDCCASNCQTFGVNGTSCDSPQDCILEGSCQNGACTGGAVGCDPCLSCQPPLGCQPPANVLCDPTPAVSSRVTLKKNASDPRRDGLSWKWKSSVPVALLDFGSPTTVTDLTLCVFDATGLRLSATAPAAGQCAGRACWSSKNETITYGDHDASPDGVTKLSLRAGAPGRAQIAAGGKGTSLGMPALSLAGEVTVRLKRSGGPACWQARYPSAQRNDATQYKARTP